MIRAIGVSHTQHANMSFDGIFHLTQSGVYSCFKNIIQQHIRACSSGIVWVETVASSPAAGGGAIPTRTGRFECPVLLAAPTVKQNYNDGE